ncbi:MAG: HupE/UreJ family protein [Xanthomarina sp.]
MFDNFLFNLEYGINHVLNIKAYDHILFLIVISVPYMFKDWKRVLLLVSIFTLGHTISLALAAYNVVSINGKLIGFLIPIIILIVALFNVFTAGKGAQKEKIGVLFFSSLFYGLVHGLGFVREFKAMIGQTNNKFIALLEVSLGIEVGQIIIAFIVLFLGYIVQTVFRFSKRDWVMVISAVVVGLLIPMIIASEYLA